MTAAGEELLKEARPLLATWDRAVAAVADAANEENRVLRVGTLTSIGRALYPGVVDGFAARQPGWRVQLRSFAQGDPTAGLAEHAADVAFLWLPVDGDSLTWSVLMTEPRMLEVSTKHR